MVRRLILLTVTVLLSWPAVLCLADARAQLEEARRLQEQGKFNEAEAMYKSILADYAGTDEALNAQERLTILYIGWRKTHNAEAAYDELLAVFSGHEGIAEAVDDVADAYREARQYKLALAAYEDIVAKWPRAQRAAEAQAGVVRCCLLRGDQAGAQDATAALLNGFVGNPQKPKAIDLVADQYRRFGRYEQALALYQHIVEHWPQGERGMESQKGAVLCSIEMGDEASATAGVQKLVSDFSGNLALPASLYDIAGAYEKARVFAKAKSIYQVVAQRYPDSRHAAKAVLDVRRADVLSLVEAGQDTAVQAAIDALIADFGGNEYLSTVVYKVAVQYHVRAYRLVKEGLTGASQGCFRAAAAIFERVVSDFPGSGHIPKACLSAGDCHQNVGDYNRSIEAYQKVVTNWPGSKHAGPAQYSIAKCYEALKSAGVIPESDADLKIERAYKAVVEKYPSYSKFEDAVLKLAQASFERGQWATAAHYFELCLKKYSQSEGHKAAPYTLYPLLGRSYEGLGAFDQAAQVYGEFIKAADPADKRVEAVKIWLENLEGDKK